MKKENYIGLELAKKLKENNCEIDSVDYSWFNEKLYGKNNVGEFQGTSDWTKDYNIRTYSYYDILITNAKEFFVEMEKGQLRTVTTVMIEALRKGDTKLVDAEFWENCKFNPENK